MYSDISADKYTSINNSRVAPRSKVCCGWVGVWEWRKFFMSFGVNVMHTSLHIQ